MSTSWGFYCPDHDETCLFDGGRDYAVKGLWTARDAIVAYDEVTEASWAWAFNLPDLDGRITKALRRHQSCTVRLANGYGDIGEVLGDTEPLCSTPHHIYNCQLPAGHGPWHHHATETFSHRWRDL